MMDTETVSEKLTTISIFTQLISQKHFFVILWYIISVYKFEHVIHSAFKVDISLCTSSYVFEHPPVQ
jgi:hypothetical protein